MLSSLSQAKKKSNPTLITACAWPLKSPQEQTAAEISPLSLLAANIWFPAMIHGGALPSPSSPSSSPSAVVWDGIGFCGKGKKVFGVSHSLMESYPAGQGQDMFRWWRWWLRGMRKGGGGVHICERGCLSPGALPRERKRGELEGG